MKPLALSFSLLLAVLLLSTIQQAAIAKVFRARWVVEEKIVNPDCKQNRKTVVVNGGMPGPSVDVISGDRVEITVTNKQRLDLTIHWHGITQHDSQWHDGVQGVTQCSIAPGTSFTYNFSTAGHHGTLWWHAHTIMLRGSVLGHLNVHEFGKNTRPVPISRNKNLMLMDWYLPSPAELDKSILGVPFSGFPTPDSLLINGRSTCDGKADVLIVKPGKWYRLRVVNGAMYAQFNLVVQNHQLWTFETEGGFMKKAAYSSFDTMSGQSYSFLIHANQKPGTYWVMARPRYDVEGLDLWPGVMTIKYEGTNAPAFGAKKLAVTGPQVAYNPGFTWNQIAVTGGADKVPDWAHKVDKLILLQLNMHLMPNQAVRYSINNVTGNLPVNDPLLLQLYQGTQDYGVMADLPPKGFKGATRMKPSKVATEVIDIPYGATIQLVMQNFIPPGLNHPLHLHGHNFFVVGRGAGYFDASKWDKYDYNLKDPLFRNTMFVLENTWTAVRFKADNPGVWILHCHLEPHVDTGMMAFFRTQKPGAIPAPPKDFPQCLAAKKPGPHRK